MDKAWVDVSSPTKEEVDSLMLSYNIDPSIARDLLAPTPKQEVLSSDGFVYMVLHIPVFSHSKYEVIEQEIDCVITSENLITVRYDSIDALHYFAKQIEVEEILNKTSVTHPLFGMTKEIYKFLFDEISFMDGYLREIEQKIFAGQEKEMVFAISGASRNLLSFRRMLGPQMLVWQSLKDEAHEKFGQEFVSGIHPIISELNRIMKSVDGLSEMINELRETNNSLLSTKQNEIVQTLTILAFITVPFAIISQIFGMATLSTPLIGLRYDFWIVMGIMLLTALIMYAYFRLKKWL